MSISNLTVPNNFDLFSNTLTANTVISNRPPATQVGGLCVTTTLNGADSPNGTANNTVAEQNISVYFSKINGVCYLWKEGTSGSFPDPSQNDALKTDLAETNSLFLLARSSTPTGADGGGVFIPPGTFPLCQSALGQKVYIGMCTINIPLKQGTVTPVGITPVPAIMNFHTEHPNGQYFQINIPRSYDYIKDGDDGITANLNIVGDGGTIGNQLVRYVSQNYSGSDVGGQQNSIPPFYIQYPISE